MAEVLMIECDNPKCDSVGTPEHVPERKTKTSRVIGPYGWLQGHLWAIGCGPGTDFVACCEDCVGPAVAYLMEEARRKERDAR